MNKFYVAILEGNELRYITAVDLEAKTVTWEDKKQGVAIPVKTAEEIYNGLRWKGYRAVIVMLPEGEQVWNNFTN